MHLVYRFYILKKAIQIKHAKSQMINRALFRSVGCTVPLHAVFHFVLTGGQ